MAFIIEATLRLLTLSHKSSPVAMGTNTMQIDVLTEIILLCFGYQQDPMPHTAYRASSSARAVPCSLAS